MQTIRWTAVTISLAALCTAGLTAQTQETKTTTNTKVEIKGGKDVTVIGCLDRSANGDYLVTEIRENRALAPSRFMLVASEDLSKHVGERVEIQGKTAGDGSGKVSVESKTRTEVDNGKDEQAKTKTEGTSGTLDLPFLGVKSIKTLASTCTY